MRLAFRGLLAIVCLFVVAPLRADDAPTLSIVVDAPLAPPARLALEELEARIGARAEIENAKAKARFTVQRLTELPESGSSLVIGCAGQSPLVDKLRAENQVALAEQPESLAIRKLSQQPPRWLITGRDARGLAYAIREVARAIALAPFDGTEPWAAITEATESPFLRHRSMTVHLFNADLEESWYFSEKFWLDYFSLLVRSRYNNLTLTFCDQTNYLNPIYAYLLDVPGYSQVRVKGLTDTERNRRLKMLRRIAELADEHDLQFTLGIWTQLPVASFVGGDEVENLPEGAAAADYCAAGLKELLKQCPKVGAIQFRMNIEAGIPEDRQTEFYGPLFQAIRDCGRPMPVDLRYKGLRPETLAEAQKLGLDVAISTKFWCEHLGLPYHPTVADRHYRDSRYSFGNLLQHPRSYKIIYQLWSVGSQRLFLWGDPDYATRFARSCQLGDGEGFEVFAPLTDMGFGNKPGNWPLFKDASSQSGDWNFERYWFFYLLFGRMGYNPDTDPEVWRREFRQRFGDAAERIEAAYRSASQIIPLITASHQLSAGEWMWWPEMDTGDRLLEYMYAQPGDTAQFYAIRSWKRTPNWRVEEWDDSIPGYVEDAVAGKLSAKWTPIQVSAHLKGLSWKTATSLGKNEELLQKSPEYRSTELDLSLVALLADYHANKKLAATYLGTYEQTGHRDRLDTALHHMRAALIDWRAIAEGASAYYDNLVFGYSPEHGRKMGHHHSGHWRDRLPEVEADVKYLEDLIAKHGSGDKKVRLYPGETVPTELPRVDHEPITSAAPDVDLTISAKVSCKAPLGKVILHYRRLDQTADWQQVAMTKSGDQYRATIPGREISKRFDFQYYVEALLAEGGGTLWPSWEKGPPYVVVKVKPAAGK